MASDNTSGIAFPTIVTLCGSTKFRDAFNEANYTESMAGNIVLSVGFFAHVDKEHPTLTPEDKMRLDWLHKRKIDMSDEILVINVDDYIGPSTSSEIQHAKDTGKKIRYFLPHDFKGRGIVPGREEMVTFTDSSSRDDPLHSNAGDETFPMGN